MAHFGQLLLRRLDPDNVRTDLLVGIWKPPSGFTYLGHFRTAIDSMEHAHVITDLPQCQRHNGHRYDGDS